MGRAKLGIYNSSGLCPSGYNTIVRDEASTGKVGWLAWCRIVEVSKGQSLLLVKILVGGVCPPSYVTKFIKSFTTLVLQLTESFATLIL